MPYTSLRPLLLPLLLRALLIPLAVVVLMTGGCENKRPVTIGGEPVQHQATVDWAVSLDNFEQSAIVFSRIVESAQENGLITVQAHQDFLTKVATPASLAIQQAREQLITYDRTGTQDALARFTAHFNTASELVASVVAYASQFGVVQVEKQ